MLSIALLFMAPAFVALNAQRSGFSETLRATEAERSGLRAIDDTKSFLVALERYRNDLTRGRGLTSRQAVERYARHLKRFALSGHARVRRDALVRAWSNLALHPTLAAADRLKSDAIQLSAAVADSSGLSFDGDVTVANFTDAVAYALPHVIEELGCYAATATAATAAGSLSTPERLTAALCLSSVDSDLNELLSSDLELDASDAALALSIKRRLLPELRSMHELRQLAYGTLLVPVSPLAGAAATIPRSAALLRSHEALGATLAAVVDKRLGLRERKTRSALVALEYLYLATLLGGIGLVILLTHLIAARDNRDLERAHRRYREVENELARARAERALELSEAQFRAVFDAAPLGMAVTDAEGVVVQTNEALDELLGSETLLLADNEPAFRELLNERKKSVRLERQYTHRDGHKLWGELTLSVVRDRDDRPQFAVGMLQDTTDRKQSELRLRHEASHDALTGLANRAHFMENLERLRAEMRDPRCGNSTVLYIDVDKFKAINDTFGHEAGDHVLRSIAERLRLCTRAQDYIARFGGDEFVVLLTGVTSAQETKRFVEAMHRQMAIPVVHLGREIRVSVSIGSAAGFDAHASAERVLREADASMYRAKRRSSPPDAVTR